MRLFFAHEDPRALAAARIGPAAGGLPLPRRERHELRLGDDRGLRDRHLQHAAAPAAGAADAAGDAADAGPVPVRHQRADVLGRGQRARRLLGRRLHRRADRLADLQRLRHRL